MSIGIKVKRGLDLHLEGSVADTSAITAKPTRTVAVIPDDFLGIVPKMDVREGDRVTSGQPLFHGRLRLHTPRHRRGARQCAESKKAAAGIGAVGHDEPASLRHSA